MKVVWTDYMKYRASLRGFDLSKLEHIMLSSEERYIDTVTHRRIVIGCYGKTLVLMPFEQEGDKAIAVTVHVTTRKQINFRLKTGRFSYE